VDTNFEANNLLADTLLILSSWKLRCDRGGRWSAAEIRQAAYDDERTTWFTATRLPSVEILGS
jgi:hypothetical protein